MIKRYTIENRPIFKDGDKVKIDASCFGYTDNSILSGKIVGLAYKNAIDLWIVELNEYPHKTYPFKVLCVQHTFIIDES